MQAGKWKDSKHLLRVTSKDVQGMEDSLELPERILQRSTIAQTEFYWKITLYSSPLHDIGDATSVIKTFQRRQPVLNINVLNSLDITNQYSTCRAKVNVRIFKSCQNTVNCWRQTFLNSRSSENLAQFAAKRDELKKIFERIWQLSGRHLTTLEDFVLSLTLHNRNLSKYLDPVGYSFFI